MDRNIPDTTSWGEPDWGIRVPPRDERGIFLPDCLVGRPGAVPELAPPNHGLAQRGSVVDPKTPDFDFGIVQKTEVWAENIADLVEQAKQGQWNATTDIPWRDLPELEEDLERAVCQVCTFMIQNEYLALYLPAKFIGRIDPCFSEVILFLSSQVMDEARHVEVFTKRALANGGGLQYVSSATEWSLQSLLAQEDFTDASFLLHVLGEGTFMELLRFLEEVSAGPRHGPGLQTRPAGRGPPRWLRSLPHRISRPAATRGHHPARPGSRKTHRLPAAGFRREPLRAEGDDDPRRRRVLARSDREGPFPGARPLQYHAQQTYSGTGAGGLRRRDRRPYLRAPRQRRQELHVTVLVE